ncbi:hypothetical protein F5B22DRAFT_650902 [Xylaria bambusicola]|uniref:uncharacterized protein n=1 Tax=Xylaria bambusicola TaxID=326684 RepID=UPI002007C44B|nr:uncharacterized protein F5B22DRAFT_650902 [Xylaria bambusicola]KAI0506342.1 hypothetical protein F5B22DRAFT_650902 [Xylaria bambusicola]
MSALLQELSQWSAGRKLNLIINMHSPMDGYHRGHDKFDHDRYQVRLGRRDDLFHDRYRYSYIRFTDAFHAVVPCVTTFYVHYGPRSLDPGSLVALTAAFPNLEGINWLYRDSVHFPALRRGQMHEFASAVASFRPPPACKTLYIYIKSQWYPHKERLPDLGSGDGTVCSAPRTMLGRSSIERLDYEGPIDPTLFWATQGASLDADDACAWKSLREMEICFGLGLPEDRFYDKGSDVPLPPDAADLLPPGYYDSDEQNAAAVAAAKTIEMPKDDKGHIVAGCEFRWLPRDEAILPLLEAVAHRLTRTPSLRRVYLEASLPRGSGLWFFSYQAPGEVSAWDEYVEREDLACDDPMTRARVFLHAARRPNEETVARLRGIGTALYGEDTIVTFFPLLRQFQSVK